MKEFMFIIRGGQEKYTSASKEEMQQHMEKWQKWMGEMAANGTLINGQPLMEEGKTLADRGEKVTDRPFAEGKELVGGYLLIKTESLDHAAKIAKDCPSFDYGCTVEVREISPME